MIAYLSLTGNVRKFVKSVGMESLEIDYSNPFVQMEKDFIVIVPSYDDEITEFFSQFIDYKDNRAHLIGIIGSGNRNFSTSFCFNAEDLSKKYKKPLLMKFEISGTMADVVKFKEEVEKIGITKIIN